MIQGNECIKLVIECFDKKELKFPENLILNNMNLSEVDLCLEVVADILCEEGFMENSEPNSYGLQLEDVVDYLLNIRYALVD